MLTCGFRQTFPPSLRIPYSQCSNAFPLHFTRYSCSVLSYSVGQTEAKCCSHNNGGCAPVQYTAVVISHCCTLSTVCSTISTGHTLPPPNCSSKKRRNICSYLSNNSLPKVRTLRIFQLYCYVARGPQFNIKLAAPSSYRTINPVASSLNSNNTIKFCAI